MRVAIVNLILETPNIRPALIFEDVRRMSAAELREVNIVEFGKALADRGHDVTVYVADSFLEDGDVQLENRLMIRGVPCRLPRIFHPALLPLTPTLPKRLLADGADVIQSGEFHHPGTFFASQTAARTGVPLIVWQESYRHMRAPGSFYERGFRFTAGRFVIGNASRFVPRTSRARNYLISLRVPSELITPWIPTGIDATVFHPQRQPQRRVDAGLGKDPHVLLMVSRLSQDKRVDLAIRALANLRKQGKDVTLLVRGSGPEERDLKVLARRLGIRNRVHFVPRMSREELVNLYNTADVFLLTSSRDLLPFALIQAAACGIPSVSVSVGSVSDVVVPNATGLMAPGTPADFAAAVGQLLDDEDRRLSMGRAARRRVEEIFDMNVVARNLESVYTETRGKGPVTSDGSRRGL